MESIKQITISIPVDYNVSAFLFTISPIEMSEILTLGEIMLKEGKRESQLYAEGKIGRELKEENTRLKATIANLRNEVEISIKTKYETKIEAMKDEIEKIGKITKQRIDTLNDQHKTEIDQLNTFIATIQGQSEQRKTELNDCLTKLTANYSERLHDATQHHKAEVEQLNSTISRLNEAISQLTTDSKERLETRERELNERYQSEILRLNETINQLNETINRLTANYQGQVEKQTDELNERHKQETNQLNEIIGKLTSDSKERLELREHELTERYQSEINKLNELIMQIKSQFEMRESESNEHHQQEITRLNEMINKTLADIKSSTDNVSKLIGTNREKMETGEEMIEQLILQYYPDAVIVNTSAIPHSGDRSVKIKVSTDRWMTIMVEVKNKKYVASDDMSKFKEDIERTPADGYLFASLRSPVFGIGNFGISVINNCPIVYISNIVDCQYSIRLAIETIIQLKTQYQLMGQEGEAITNLTNNIKIIYEKISGFTDQVKSIQRARIALDATVDSLNKAVVELIDQIGKLIGVNQSSSSEDIIMKIANHMTQHGGHKITIAEINELGITQHQIRLLGGIKKINDDALALIERWRTASIGGSSENQPN